MAIWLYTIESTVLRVQKLAQQKGGTDDLAVQLAIMNVYTYVSRSEALGDPEVNFVKVKWVRTNNGPAADPSIKCPLVAQELGYCKRVDELFRARRRSRPCGWPYYTRPTEGGNGAAGS